MDLSSDVQELHQQFKFIKTKNDSDSPNSASSRSDYHFDVIDVDNITFGSDETWLCKTSNCSENKVIDINNWLHKDLGNVIDDDLIFNISKTQNEYQKSIDSRTFTRPKKRFTRPSIEKYNEEVYGNSDTQNDRNFSMSSMKRSNDSGILSGSSVIQEVTELTSTKPLNFDLTQPTNSYYFENILANSAEIDSFQNMSPPSLVNSMCSSTFANLMDSSFIKNDPILREIRDTDFTESVLLQDSEPPMFQSITESCSSINSDTPESFLKKISFNGTFRKNISKEFDKSTVDKLNNSSVDMNLTYEKLKESGSQMVDFHNINDVENQEVNSQPFTNFNGTYRRSPKSNNTYRKSDVANSYLVLNSTFQVVPNKNISEQNTTQTLIKDCSIKSFEGKKTFPNSRTIINEDIVEDMKKQLSETVQITDLNRLSYCLDETVRLDSTYTEDNNDLNTTVTMQCSSLGCPTGSADSLDRMSSLSNSSRESNKMLNMADVDAIVEMQERSLQQVMSTPKLNTGTKKLWENNFISPIISNEHLSDSDLSSNDEYKSVKSSYSLENFSSKPTKNLAHLGGNIDTKMKTNQRSTYTLASQKPLQAIPNNIRASYGNLRTIQSSIPGSQSNLYKPSHVRPTSSTSNLKTMGQKLKGSYTSLRPINANLPVAPPIISHLNTTTTLTRATNPNVTQNIEGHAKVLEVSPMPREKIAVTGNNHFVKPQNPRASGLPRPTGIPRPASRIPGPRSNLRPHSSRSGNIGRQTKDDYQ